MEEELKKFLSQFGKVEVCEVYDDEVKIKITDGWDNSIKGFKNMQLIQDKIEELTGQEFPFIRETKADTNLLKTIFYK